MITKIDYILTPWELAHTMNQPLFFLMAFDSLFANCNTIFRLVKQEITLYIDINSKIRLIILFAAEDGETLYS